MTTYLQEYRCRLCRARFVVTEHPVDDGVHDLQSYAIALNHYDQLHQFHQYPEPHVPRIGTGDFVGGAEVMAIEPEAELRRMDTGEARGLPGLIVRRLSTGGPA